MSQPLYRPVRIGGALIPGNLFLAPLAGYSDAAFRSLCTDYGADMSYSEMLSAEGFIRSGKKTAVLLERAANEKYFGVQLFTESPYSAAKAARALGELAPLPALLDLNCGCPVPKVVKTGAGSALLKSPRLLYDVVKALAENSPLPVSVKIRSGWDAHSLNYRETADAACRAGAALVCLHARTRSQGYAGAADWAQIKDLKEHCTVPVFGSGDVFCARDARRMLEETGCDGVMFARGAIGNPFIFRETKSLLETGCCAAASPEESLAAGLDHLERCVRLKGEDLACREMRKHFAAYTRGIPGGNRMRAAFVRARTVEEYRRIVEEKLSGENGPPAQLRTAPL